MIVLVCGRGSKCTCLVVVVALFTLLEVDRKGLLFHGRTVQKPEHREHLVNHRTLVRSVSLPIR